MVKKILKKLLFILNIVGFDLVKFIKFIIGIPYFIRCLIELKKQNKNNERFRFGKFYPILNERFSDGGTINGHYFHQDLLIAQRIYQNNPIRHIDIGSRIDGFVAHVATFRKIEIYDIRSIESNVENIVYNQADLMQLNDDMVGICDSISSLHAIEHFGIGRYGDPIDINGHLKAINNLTSMLKPGGKFYFSVPIGQTRIEFNAHRVFSLHYLINILSKDFNIDNFNYVDDSGKLHVNVCLTEIDIHKNYKCSYGCGIFELTKI
jgi:hypothetical protein